MAHSSLTDILSSPVWTAVGTAFAALGALFAIYVFYRGRTTRALNCVVDATRITGFRGDAAEPESDSLFLGLMLQNVGNVPIRADEFDRPLVLPLPQGAKPESVRIKAVRPVDVAPTVWLDDSAVTIEPLLLNPGDQLELSVELSAFIEAVTDGGAIRMPPVRARVVGVTELTADPSLVWPQPGVLRRCALALGAMSWPKLLATALGLGLVPPALVFLARAIAEL